MPIAPADLPEHALGLGGLHALLIEDFATSELNDLQREAIHNWVLRGGQLIVGGGDGLQRTLDGLPPELLPAFAGDTVPRPAEALFGSNATGLPPVPVAALNPRADDELPPYRLPLAGIVGDGDLAVEQSVGRGAVTMLAFPLSHPALAGWERAPLLWLELLRAGNELPPGFAPEHVTPDSFVEGNLASALTSLPALQFPPLGLLIALVVVYIILVGPVTYLVLRRLDRQELGWAIVPLLTLLFSGLTFGLGYLQRGGDVVQNQIALIEPLDGADAARVRSFVGIFSPEQRSYSLATDGFADESPLLRPISLQGPWDMNAGATSGLFLQEGDRAAGANEFEVAQWAMRALTSDSVVAGSFVDARIMIAGETMLGEATNTGSSVLRDVVLVQGDRVVRLGDLAPGETKRGELQRRQGNRDGFGPVMPVSYLIYGDEIDRQGRGGGQPLPRETQQRIRLLDALYNYGPSTRGGQPLLLAWSDQFALDLLPATVRSDEQHSAMIAATPRIETNAELSLGPGWFVPRFEGGQSSACFGGLGSGLVLGQEPAVLRLTLPRDLYGLRPSELTLITNSDTPWQNDTSVELFDWSSGSWEQIAITARQLQIEEPARFLGSHGALRVRVGSERGGGNFGCIYLDARLKGSMP